MPMHISAYGRLGRDPEQHETKAGAVMAVGPVAVDASRDPEGPPVWVRVLAFGRQAEALLRLRRGDPVSVSGRLQVSHFTGKDGVARESWELMVDAIVSARLEQPLPRAEEG